ncbi:MAG TPA: tetratricopeptide repeat protein [Gemmatimonadota bacterium]|nr:tetratricopeptide repeat protein [Gemmatimonadota bacterium]
MASNSNGSDEIGRFEAQYRQNPDSLVFARLADACRKKGDPERALSILADGIGRHPDYPSAHIVRARCLVDLDRLADAEESLRRVIELDAQNLVAIQGLANLAERRDDPVEAVRWYEQIATLDPMNVEAAAALARLRPTPPPPAKGLEPLPAPSEEWWSSPAFQIEEGDDALPPEPAEPAAVPEPEDAPPGESGTAWWFEDPGEDESADDGDLLTRTMAELYTKQGLLDEAAAIYRELLTDRPEDETLRRALDELEQRIDKAGDEPAHVKDEPAEEKDEPTDVEDEPVEERAETVVADPAAEVAVAADTSAVRSSVDPFATHPVPATSGTGEVLDDWLRRLAG